MILGSTKYNKKLIKMIDLCSLTRRESLKLFKDRFVESLNILQEASLISLASNKTVSFPKNVQIHPLDRNSQ